MNHRRRLILAGACALIAPGPTLAQRKVHQVGVLSIGTDPATLGRWQSFVDAMQALNYIEGRNVKFLWGFGAGNFGMMPVHLENFLKAGADVSRSRPTRSRRSDRTSSRRRRRWV